MAKRRDPFNYIKAQEQSDNGNIFGGSEGGGSRDGIIDKRGSIPGRNAIQHTPGPGSLPKTGINTGGAMGGRNTESYNGGGTGGWGHHTPGRGDAYPEIGRVTAGNPGFGEGMAGPGNQGGMATWIDFYSNTLMNEGILNMNDLYDYYQENPDWYLFGNAESWEDFLSNQGSNYQWGENYGGAESNVNPNVPWVPSGGTAGGGSQGGAGDLGTGSSFAGGGMYSSIIGGSGGQGGGEGDTGLDWNQYGGDCLEAWSNAGAPGGYLAWASNNC